MMPAPAPVGVAPPLADVSTTSNAASGSPPAVAAPLALEDLVARALPAVVVVETRHGTGSGFFVSDIHVLTSAHVVLDQAIVTLRLASNEAIAARVAALDSSADLALLRAPDPTVPRHTLPIGSITTVKIGQQVFVVGSPLGTFSNTVTRGIVSARRTFDGVDFVQTDAAINPGNSGGPVIDAAGQVIGVATGKALGGESLGFAVAIDYAQPLLEGRAPARSAGTVRALEPPAAIARPAPSETERRRIQGTQAYEQDVKALAEAADRVDAEWARHAAVCDRSGRAPGLPDRPWLLLLTEPSSVLNDADPQCQALGRDLRSYVQQIADHMRQANDRARRAGVYPGVQRETRQKYRMRWDGWDR
jgi:hypothetical protein